MIFASLEFLTIFLPAFLLLYAVTPTPARNLVLLLASWLFYGWWNPTFLLLFIALTILAWAGGLLLARLHRRRRAALACLIVFNLSVLAWFKYANIVVDTAAGMLGQTGFVWRHVVLPIGLSFTVLQAISYFVDVYRGRFPAERRLLDFATYLAMFGHLVAGPIIRYDWIRTRLAHRALRWDRFCAGARRFMTGLVMKVLVADTLAPVAAQVFGSTRPSLVDAWLGCLAYTLQLYFDFAGYSAMAIGIGLMLGFRFPENFRRPYLARDLAQFWRRWHISLSSWLRDYLYIPLGGSRKGLARTCINLLITMAIGGLWHGADSWNFLYWGMLHGAGLAVLRLWRSTGWRLPALLAHVLTLVFVMLGWTLFRSPDASVAQDMLAGQLGLHQAGMSETLHNLMRVPVLLAFFFGLLWVVEPWTRLRLVRGPLMAGLRHLALTVGFLLAFALVAARGATPFLYFQF